MEGVLARPSKKQYQQHHQITFLQNLSSIYYKLSTWGASLGRLKQVFEKLIKDGAGAMGETIATGGGSAKGGKRTIRKNHKKKKRTRRKSSKKRIRKSTKLRTLKTRVKRKRRRKTINKKRK